MEAARGPAINTYSTIKKPLAIRTQRFKMIDLRYMMAYDETVFFNPRNEAPGLMIYAKLE